MRMVRMHLLANQTSALANLKIGFSTIFRDHNALSQRAKHEPSLQAAALCSKDLDLELASVFINLESTQDLMDLNVTMETADDQQMVSLSLRNHTLGTQDAIEMLDLATKSELRFCPADEEELNKIQSWAAQSIPVLDRIKETAVAMSK